uniref:Choline transporter-like protein n=1 Tax=Diabrotica virgifera virgifera TaxID=50390 RepID=A0A6P7GMK6_DIAVI
TFLFLGVTVALWFYFCLWIESSGTLTETRANVFYYKKDGWMKFTRWYNFFGMLWMAQFIIGCQHMVIAGAVSIWYFKSTTIFGYPFCRAGQQAFKLLSSNVLRVAAINSVGDFVLFLGKVVVVIATVLIGIRMLEHKDGLQHMWVPIALSGLFAYFVAHCFMTVYEMVIDTIFLCFCEDCEQNDGESRPYFMSRGLMEFVENSKKALDIYDTRAKSSATELKSVPTISGDVTRNFSG